MKIYKNAVGGIKTEAIFIPSLLHNPPRDTHSSELGGTLHTCTVCLYPHRYT